MSLQLILEGILLDGGQPNFTHKVKFTEYGIWSGCLLDATRWRSPRHVHPELTGGIIYPMWPGNTSGSPRGSWKVLLGRSLTGIHCLARCQHNLIMLSLTLMVWERVAHWNRAITPNITYCKWESIFWCSFVWLMGNVGSSLKAVTRTITAPSHVAKQDLRSTLAFIPANKETKQQLINISLAADN